MPFIDIQDGVTPRHYMHPVHRTIHRSMIHLRVADDPVFGCGLIDSRVVHLRMVQR